MTKDTTHDQPSRGTSADHKAEIACDALAQKYSLDQLRQGDERLFTDVINAYTPLITYYLQQRLGAGDHVPSAEDITQETMIKLWNHKAGIEGDFKSMNRYIYTIARHSLYDSYRRNKKRTHLPLDDGMPVSSGCPVVKIETKNQVDYAFHLAKNVLPRGYGNVILKTYREGMDTLTVAADMNVHPGTVKSQRSRALARLRSILSPDD